jgi:cobalt-zinc-cadmium efflux system outer membrane protein
LRSGRSLRSIAQPFIGVAISSTLLTACATVPPHAGFSDVQTLVAARTPVSTGQLVWRTASDTTSSILQANRALIDRAFARGLTPSSAVAIALVQNPSIQATYARLGVARADIIDARLAPNPFVDLAALRANAANAFELNVTQAVFSLFQLPRRRRAADAAFVTTKLSVAQAVLDLMARTRTAYYASVAAEQLYEVDSTAAVATALAADFAQRQHKAGNITDLELAAHMALAAETRLDVVRARRERVDAREDLTVVLGLAQRDTAGNLLRNFRQRLPDPLTSEPSLADIEQTAITQRLDLSASRVDITAAGAAFGLSGSAELIPDIAVGVRIERDAEGTTARGLLASFPLPIFDRGQGSRARAIAQLEAARAQYIGLALDVRSQVRRAQAAVIATRERALTLRDVVLPLRHRVVEQAQLEYNGMQAGVYQLLQAKRDEIAAAREYVAALRDYWTARTTLDVAVGVVVDKGASDAAFTTPPQPPAQSPSDSSHDTHSHH